MIEGENSMQEEYFLQLFLNEYAGNYNGGRLCSYITGVDTELGRHSELQQDFMRSVFPDEYSNPFVELIEWKMDENYGYLTTDTLVYNQETKAFDILRIYLYSIPTNKDIDIIVNRMQQVNNGDFAKLTKNKTHENLKIKSCKVIKREINIKDTQLHERRISVISTSGF